MIIDHTHPLAQYIRVIKGDTMLGCVEKADTKTKVAQIVVHHDRKLWKTEVPFDRIDVRPDIPASLLALKPEDIPIGRE